MLLSVLFSPVLIDAQTRSLEEQQAISHISQAEYYARMALRSLEASEKIGKAPYFNYQNAREDIEKVLDRIQDLSQRRRIHGSSASGAFDC